MKPGYQGLHQGQRFPITHPDGTVEYLTAKELLARRGRLNREYEWTEKPSPGAGARRVRDPQGNVQLREGGGSDD